MKNRIGYILPAILYIFILSPIFHNAYASSTDMNTYDTHGEAYSAFQAELQRALTDGIPPGLICFSEWVVRVDDDQPKEFYAWGGDYYYYTFFEGCLHSPYDHVNINRYYRFPKSTLCDGEDEDEDGAWDCMDQCIPTPEGDAVCLDQIYGCPEQNAEYGCSLDTDNDGVADNKDYCENTLSLSVPNSNGCSDIQMGNDPQELCPIKAMSQKANPISIYNGNQYESFTDVALNTPFQGGLVFKRYYNSLSEYEGTMGYGWTHS